MTVSKYQISIATYNEIAAEVLKEAANRYEKKHGPFALAPKELRAWADELLTKTCPICHDLGQTPTGPAGREWQWCPRCLPNTDTDLIDEDPPEESVLQDWREYEDD